LEDTFELKDAFIALLLNLKRIDRELTYDKSEVSTLTELLRATQIDVSQEHGSCKS